jgi:hypothetical protein
MTPIKNPVLYWERIAATHLVGRTIVKVRYLDAKESEALGWHGQRALVFQLDNGTMFFPSRDDEGNGPGSLFGQGPDGTEITLPTIY